MRHSQEATDTALDWCIELISQSNVLEVGAKYAILDALNAFDGPVIEIHISQVHKREAFRHHSYVSHRADAVMAGFGVEGYELAVRRMGTLLA